MELKKFYDIEEACDYAATLNQAWRCEDDDVIGPQEVLECLQECPLDEGNEEEYFVVNEIGSIGYTGNDGRTYYWAFVPADHPEAKVGEMQTCPACGALIEEDWAFCEQCGKKL